VPARLRRFPADPSLHCLSLSADAFGLVVMKAITTPPSSQQFLHGVAVLDAVNGDCHFNPFRMPLVRRLL
jgi:hypothetical protein